ncbi:Protein of unknown function (DUF3040) [Saccharopolyspora erythraea NRRL 2338]|nr:DUF3040 domain-containing protein [Saccharopolyspora erythraea]EQD87468.1 hypothetical protein N599_04280 [Saccharopolyspora erythraea D]PFG95547.1 Protein of unknown function (DUF3040) [Saccharopolyspora erythraea NRRL 2338]QRK92168.1 DUF3040 domain-containing protein [Saccharopolyspora erythraea]
MLKRYERRRLREIELWFEANDPGLAAFVRAAPAVPAKDREARSLTSAGLVGALFVMIGGVLAVPVLVFIGSALGIGAFCWLYWLFGKTPGSR